VARDRASGSEASPLRLFVAVDVPEDVRRAVASAIEPLRARHPDGRWTPSGNWHVTLKFLGRTWPRLVPTVLGAVERVAASASRFETSVRDVGAFPSARRTRVVWVGLEDGAEPIRRIAAQLDDALASEFPRENREFTPHLTVARLDPPRPVGDELPPVQSRSFDVRELVVYRSHLRRPAPVYEPLAAFGLGGSVRPASV
jgi:RNA 2',3'-cyclic 3'-phosphodiesterase